MCRRIKIVYLYSELVGYQIPIFKEYTRFYNAEVHVFHWDKNKLKPYIPETVPGVFYYKRSEYSKEQMLIIVQKIKADIIYVSGWMDNGYLYVTKRLKRKGIKIVTAFDDIWKDTLRQRFGALIFPIFFKKFYTHAWVAGPYQFEFARRLGFKKNEIIFDMLSADTSLYKWFEVNESFAYHKKAFLYVGNLRKIKGVDILLEAFMRYRDIYNGHWELICIGNGELESILTDKPNVKLYPFLDAEEIIRISSQADVFIMPSRSDQWGVVAHEFTSLGMPIILSEYVGARATFFINGFNGYLFSDNSIDELSKLMLKFQEMNEERFLKMRRNSLLLSGRINPSISAANFMSLVQYNTN